MGKQFRFLMSEDDESILLDYLLRMNIKILHEGNNIAPLEVQSFPAQFSGVGWFMLWLYKDEWGLLKLQKCSNGTYRVESSNSPVLELSRTIVRIQQKEISYGRIWYENTYYDSGEKKQKNEKVDLFYKELRETIKSMLNKEQIIVRGMKTTIYISKSLKKYLDCGYKII